MSRRGSLVVVGTGINGIAQATLEAVEHIKRADVVFYCVVERAVELWLHELNPNAQSLSVLYAEGKERSKTYEQMTRRLVDAVKGGQKVCAAFYGHPGVLVDSTHDAIARLHRAGYSARMLPGVSADGCLYADLGLNPGDRGVQNFEASDFLAFRRRFDPTTPLILWQIGVLGESRSKKGIVCRPERLKVLRQVLRRRYPSEHRVLLYCGATFPTDAPRTEYVELGRLDRAVVLPMAMLYVPPLPQRSPDPRITAWWIASALKPPGKSHTAAHPPTRSS